MYIQPTNIRVAPTVEARCNFCFNWISGANLVKKELNCCEECVHRYLLAGFQVHTVNGDTYKFTQTREREAPDLCAKSFIDNLSELRSQHDQSQLCDELNDVIQQKQFVYEEEVLSSAANKLNMRNPDRNQIDFIKKYNTTSQFVNNHPEDQFQFGKPHQSCIFNNVNKVREVKEPMTGVKSMRRFNNLEDFGRSLDKTRFLHHYQFYYDNDTLKSYTNSHPKVEREFGDELVNIPEFNLNISSKKSADKFKTSRSNISSEISFRNQKLSDDEVRLKIDTYIESKYQSQSLQRIMAGKVKQAYDQTILLHRTLELISLKMEEIDLLCYLSLFDFDSIQTIKLINVGLTDQQLPLLVDFISNIKIETLVLTGNKLTDISLNLFLSGSLPFLKQLYLGKNPINKYRMKENINELKSKFVLYL